MKHNSEILELKKHDKDCGSSSLQICFLTKRINKINEHLKINPKDHAGQRGALVLIGKRRRLSKYLKNKNPQEYQKTIEVAGLRK